MCNLLFLVQKFIRTIIPSSEITAAYTVCRSTHQLNMLHFLLNRFSFSNNTLKALRDTAEKNKWDEGYSALFSLLNNRSNSE